MFGYVQANLADLTQEEKERYESAYCGLCRTIGKRHGQLARLGLSYDLTFLGLLLTSLYEPEEQCDSCRCMIHPCKKKCSVTNRYMEYAADMSVVLVYYKCMDDWKDDKNLTRFCYGKLLQHSCKRLEKVWPRQCTVIRQELAELARIEESKSQNPDAAANSFGRLMAELFVVQQDNWEPYLRELGYGIGKFIYIADAAVDYEKDKRKGSYNPLLLTNIEPENMKGILSSLLGESSKAFEFLPLVQDAHLLKNILYSGIWQKYNQETEKREKKKHGRRSP